MVNRKHTPAEEERTEEYLLYTPAGVELRVHRNIDTGEHIVTATGNTVPVADAGSTPADATPAE